MFAKLTTLGYKRTHLQALGFYIAYLLLLLVTTALVVGILGVIVGNESALGAGIQLGTLYPALFILALGVLILKKKGYTRRPLEVGLVLLAAAMTFYTNSLVSLIVISYLTTR